MNKAIIAIVIVIILAIGGWAIFGHKNSNNNSLYGNSNNNTPAATQPNNSGQQSSSTTNQPSATINIVNMMFTPSQVTIQKGQTVKWTNNDSTTHTVTDDLANTGGPNSGDVPPGTSYSFTFNNTGSFQYHCSIHPSMRGTIVVQ